MENNCRRKKRQRKIAPLSYRRISTRLVVMKRRIGPQYGALSWCGNSTLNWSPGGKNFFHLRGAALWKRARIQKLSFSIYLSLQSQPKLKQNRIMTHTAGRGELLIRESRGGEIIPKRLMRTRFTANWLDESWKFFFNLRMSS